MNSFEKAEIRLIRLLIKLILNSHIFCLLLINFALPFRDVGSVLRAVVGPHILLLSVLGLLLNLLYLVPLHYELRQVLVP